MSDEFDVPDSPVPLSEDRITSLAKIAVETHPEASALRTLLDAGHVSQTLEIEEEGEDGEPEMHLYFDKPAEEIERMQAINPDVPERLHIAAWPVSACLPSQN